MRNATLPSKLEYFTATASTDYSPWKSTKSLNRSQEPKYLNKTDTGCSRTDKPKIEAFAKHLAEVFKPNHSFSTDSEQVIDAIMYQDIELSPHLKSITVKEIKAFLKTYRITKLQTST